MDILDQLLYHGCTMDIKARLRGKLDLAHWFSWLVLLEGSGHRDGRHNGLGFPLLRLLPCVNGLRAKMGELLAT